MNTEPAAFAHSTRVPDPRIRILDDRGLGLRLLSGSVERLATGFYWAEGPQWFGDGRYLLFSDIPNSRILRWDDCSGQLSTFRQPSNHANGLARDTLGRLLTCEHGSRSVTRTEMDGRITTVASHFDGKRLNSPNDIICKSDDGSIWFTDPPFGISGWWEGEPAKSELPHGVYRVDSRTGAVTMVLDDLQGSNGLAFSPDEKTLYVVESRHQPNRCIWAYDVTTGKGGRWLKNKRAFVDAQGPGAYDGMAVDEQGNVWCGFGGNGSALADLDDLDGVRVYDPAGKPLLHIALPERCANICFGGRHHNRLFMAASHSLYALHVNTRGALRT
jgi:gluconolactonase